MKKILIIVLFLAFQYESQSQTINLPEWKGENITNSYLKDVNNIFDQFEGTWLYTNGNTSLKIILVKKTMCYNGKYYEDLLVGEYQYIKNGSEIINTLSKINLALPFQRSHGISGNYFPTTPTPFNDFTTDNFRIHLLFDEPLPNSCCSIELRKTTSGGADAIQIFKVSSVQNNTNSIIRDGFYTLIKQ